MVRVFLGTLAGVAALVAGGCSSKQPSAAAPVDRVPRGEYLVKSVAGCGECHTPRDAMGHLDLTRWLAGVPNRFDLVPGDDTVGSISTSNLTSSASGLASWSDAAIKHAILDGVDDLGLPLYPLMPYYVFHNMTSDDADAIVAYLRTVPPIDSVIPGRQALPVPLDAPANPVPEPAIPHTRLAKDDPNFARAEHGRYLAGQIGFCMDCHSVWRPSSDQPLELTTLFGGRRAFSAKDWGIPQPSPALIFSYNITPHSSGIKGWSADTVAGVLASNNDDEGKALCGPMPGGPMGAFGSLTPGDALDIGYYVTTLPGIDSGDIPECPIPPPDPTP